jgi:hypothetical protein
MECSCCRIHRYVAAPPEQLGQTVFLLSLALAFVPNAVIGLHLSLNGIDAAKVQGCHIYTVPNYQRRFFKRMAKKFQKNIFWRSSQSETLLLQIFANEKFLVQHFEKTLR